MPAILATSCSLLAAVAVIAGVGTLIGVRVSQEYPTLVGDVTHFGHQVQSRVTSTVVTSTVVTSTVLTSTVLTSRRRRKDCG
jgi:predicted PurR-regulated permease PerM